MDEAFQDAAFADELEEKLVQFSHSNLQQWTQHISLCKCTKGIPFGHLPFDASNRTQEDEDEEEEELGLTNEALEMLDICEVSWIFKVLLHLLCGILCVINIFR